MTVPITPAEVREKRRAIIPGAVFECFNELIVKNSLENRIGTTIVSKVLQKDILALVSERTNCTDDQIIDDHWLNVEHFYRDAGWVVGYNRPMSYGGDDFDAYYEFSWSK